MITIFIIIYLRKSRVDLQLAARLKRKIYQKVRSKMALSVLKNLIEISGQIFQRKTGENRGTNEDAIPCSLPSSLSARKSQAQTSHCLTVWQRVRFSIYHP